MSRDTSEDTWVAGTEAPPRALDAERYEVIDTLGEGAIGKVERVRDRRLDRTVARKRLIDNDPSAHTRFHREARLTASLAHPGIVPVYDLSDDDGDPFYTMQEVAGEPWTDGIRSPHIAERLGQLDVLLAVARAAAHAHSRGVVHRDIKPQNVMVSALGDVWLVDWGLAIPAGATGQGVAGSPQYMAPEQARGESVDARADVWALGAVLYRLLTGEPPWHGPASDILEQVRTRPFPDPAHPDAPGALVAMVRKACATDPANRYADAGAFAADLQAYLRGQRVDAHRYGPGELLAMLVRSYRWPLSAAAFVVVVATAALVGTLVITGRERDRAVAAETLAIHRLAEALEKQAIAAPTEAWDPIAEQAAARSLTYAPSPLARGVLARHAAADHPALLARATIPCPGLAATTDYVVWRCDDGSLGAARTDAPREPLAIALSDRPTDPQTRAFIQGHTLLVNQPERFSVVDLRTGTIRHEDHEDDSSHRLLRGSAGMAHLGPVGLRSFNDAGLGPSRPIDVLLVSAAAISPTQVFLRSARPGAQAIYRCPLATDGPCTAVRKGENWGHLATIGEQLLYEDTNGGIYLLGREERLIATDAGGIEQLVATDDHIAFLSPSGDVEVFLPDGRPLGRVPTHGIRPHQITLDGSELVVVGNEVQRWRLGSRAAFTPVGVGRLATVNGQAVFAGNDHFGVVTLDQPIPAFERSGVVKSIEIEDGDVWVVTSDRGTSRMHLDGRTVVTHDQEARRGLSDGAGGLYLGGYQRSLIWVPAHGEPVERREGCWGDMAAAANGSLRICGFHTELRAIGAGGELRPIADLGQTLWALAVHPEGNPIAAALSDRSIVLVDADTGALSPLAEPLGGEVPTLTFSPNGRWLASGSWDGEVRIYDVVQRDLVAVLRGHRGRVVSLTFPRDDLLVSNGWDGRLWWWDLSVLDRDPHEMLTAIEAVAGL